MQDLDQAESILQSILKEMPEYVDARTNLERLYLLSDTKKLVAR